MENLRDLVMSIGWSVDDQALRRANKTTDEYVKSVENANKEISELEKDISSASKQGQREFSNMENSVDDFDSSIENISDPEVSGSQVVQEFNVIGSEVAELDGSIGSIVDPEISGTQAIGQLTDITFESEQADSSIDAITDPSISGAQPVRELNDIETESEQAGSSIRGMPDPTLDGSQAERELQDVEDQADSLADKLQGIGGAIAGGIGGSAIANDITSFSQVPRELQAQLGITASEAESLSTEVEDVFVSTGASIVESTEAITEVNRRFNATGNHAGELAEDMTLLSQQTGAGVGEITQAADQLESRFDDVESPQEAMDMMTEASQRLSAEGFSELIDQVGEYGGAISRAGISGNDFFGSMIDAGEESTYVMDRLGDSLSTEFIPRLQSGDEAMMDALTTMSGSEQQAKDWQTALNEGGEAGRQAVGEVLTSFTDLDQEQQNVLATDVFGSMVEDQPQIIEYMNDMVGETENVGVAVDDLEVRHEGAMNGIQERLRSTRAEVGELGDAFGGLGEIIGGGLSIFGGSFLGNIIGGLLGGGRKGNKNSNDNNSGGDNKGGGSSPGFGGFFSGGNNKGGGKGGGMFGNIGKSVKNTSELIKGASKRAPGWVGAIATAAFAAGEAAYSGLTHYQDQTLQELDSFGDDVSDSTTEAMLGYKDLSDEAATQLNRLKWTSQEVTPEIADSITGTFDQMSGQISSSMESEFGQSYSIMSDFFNNTNQMTQEQEQGILESIKSTHQQQQEELQQGQDRINEIFATASKERRDTTRQEDAEIEEIRRKMNETAVQTMSESEVEQKAIMERLKNSSSEITTQQAANTIQDSLAAKNGAIENANQQADEMIQSAIWLRDGAGAITDEQADDIIANAEKQREESVKEATKMHNDVVYQAEQQADGQLEAVNTSTGEMLSAWDMFVGDFADIINGVTGFLNGVLDFFGVGRPIPTWNHPASEAGGTNYASGTPVGGHPFDGPALVNDAPGANYKELIATPDGNMFIPQERNVMMNLPKGTQVLSGNDTKSFMSEIGTPRYEEGTDGGILSNVFSGVGDFFGALWNGASTFVGNTFDHFVPDWIKNPSDGFELFGHGAINTVKDGAIEWFQNQWSDLFSFGGGSAPVDIGASANAWRPVIAQAAAVMGQSLTEAEMNGIVAQINRESGGNQSIVQSPSVVDINTLNNNPARGLLQYIPQTFDAYNVPGHGNINSGYDQLLAFFNNTNWRSDLPYGTSGWGPSGATLYEMGGWIDEPTLAMAGEGGFGEVVIPMERHRGRAIELWKQAGQKLGLVGGGKPSPSSSNSYNGYDGYEVTNGNGLNIEKLKVNVEGSANMNSTEFEQAVERAMEKTFASLNRRMPRVQEL